MPTADIMENSGAKPFLEKTQAYLTLNPKENTNKLASLEKILQSMINSFSTSFFSTTLFNFLYLTSPTSNAFNSAIRSSLDSPGLMPVPPALA